MPTGIHFAIRALATSDLTEDRAHTLLDDPACRPHLLAELLTTPSEPSWATRVAVEELTPQDLRLIETLVIRDELPVARLEQLLTDTAGPTRGMIALAIFAGSHRKDGWTLDDLEPAWLDAILDLRAADMQIPGYECQALFTYLAQTYPATLTTLVERTLTDAEEDKYRSIPHEAWDVLHQLPSTKKVQLWRRFRDDTAAQYLLSIHLAGNDLGWLEELLDTDEMTPDQVLRCYNGLGHEPPIPELAKLLVPRGVAPTQIAGLRGTGFWWGEESDHYRSIADSFTRLVDDEDPNVRAVATAGVKMFSAASDEAAERERKQRVRGDL